MRLTGESEAPFAADQRTQLGCARAQFQCKCLKWLVRIRERVHSTLSIAMPSPAPAGRKPVFQQKQRESGSARDFLAGRVASDALRTQILRHS